MNNDTLKLILTRLDHLDATAAEILRLVRKPASNETRTVTNRPANSIYDTAPRSFPPHVPLVDKNLGSL